MSTPLNINLKTQHLNLRNMRVSDVSQDYADWLNDREINRFLSCANTVQTKESCSAYVKSYEHQTTKALIGIFFKDNGAHIGNLTFSSIDWPNKVATIGISIGRKDYMGKGVAKETLHAITDYCFKQLNLHRLQAGINTSNISSLNLFIKCGFNIEELLRESGVIDGKFQDSYIVSILNPRT